MRWKLCLGGFAAVLFAATAWSQEGNPKAGKKLAYTCTGCHGIPGYNNAFPAYKVPKIGGQNYGYLVSALQAYKAGKRPHPTMKIQARSLSDQDIRDIAAYISNQGADSQGNDDE